MSHAILVALCYSVIAGIMNGSFALPTQYVRTWSFEHIWLNYAIWAFLILPWLTIFLLDPQVSHVYKIMSLKVWMTLLIGGFLFGAGQVCFALALNSIGIGLGFIINIGLGTALGFLLPLVTLHKGQLFSHASIIAFIGIFLIIVGLLISYYAGRQRDKEKPTDSSSVVNQPIKKSVYSLGVLLAIFAGIFSAGQNFTFALTSDMQQIALSLKIASLPASIIIWPPFLTCSFIPYLLYMLYLHHKNNSFKAYKAPGLLRNNIFGIVMGLFWFGSLAIYSKASLLIGSLGPIIAWPLFMVLIILTSNFWGWRHQEWSDCRYAIKRYALLSIALLVFAVIVLAYSANLSH